MGFYKYSALALLGLRAVGVFAVADAATEKKAPAPPLAVLITTSFPQAEVFGVKLVNGHATRAVVEITNNEALPIQLGLIVGALSTLNPIAPDLPPSAAIVRNLTHTRYDTEIAAGDKKSFPYTFTTDMNPQDLRLDLFAVMASEVGDLYQLEAYNGTVSVVEAATSIFDPQIIFLYLVLLSAFVGTLYFVYKTWIETLFPHAKRGGKGTKRSSGSSKKVADITATTGAEGEAVATGAQKSYDESWIPEHHINRPVAKRVKSGASSKQKTRVVAE